MDKEKFVAELIANKASQFEESDTEWLSGLEEKQLEKLTPVAGSGDAGVKALEEAEEKIKALQKKVDEATPIKAQKKEVPPPQTPEEYILGAPVAMREVLSAGLRANESRRVELTTQIKANSKNKFADTYLDVAPLEVLENLAALAVTDDYSTRGGPRYNEKDPNAIPAPAQVFDLTRKAS